MSLSPPAPAYVLQDDGPEKLFALESFPQDQFLGDSD